MPLSCLAQPRLRCVSDAELLFDAILNPDGVTAALREHWDGSLRTIGSTNDRWSIDVDLPDETSQRLEIWHPSPLVISPLDQHGRPVCRHVFAAVSQSPATLAVTVASDGPDFLITFGGWMAGMAWALSVEPAGASISIDTAAANGVAQVARLSLAADPDDTELTIVNPFGASLSVSFPHDATAGEIQTAINALALTGASGTCASTRRDVYLHQVTYGTDPEGRDWSDAAIWLDLLDHRITPETLTLTSRQIIAGFAINAGNGPSRACSIRVVAGPGLLNGDIHPYINGLACGEASQWGFGFVLVDPETLIGFAQSSLQLLHAEDSGWLLRIDQARKLSDGLPFNADTDFISYLFLPPADTVIDGHNPQTVRFTFARMQARILGTNAAAPPVDGVDVLDLSGLYFDVHFHDCGDARPLTRRLEAVVTDWPANSFFGSCPDCDATLNGTHTLEPLALPDNSGPDLPTSYDRLQFRRMATVTLMTAADCGVSAPAQRTIAMALIQRLDANVRDLDDATSPSDIYETCGDRPIARNWQPDEQWLLIRILDQTDETHYRKVWHWFSPDRPVRLDDDTPATFTFDHTDRENVGVGSGNECPPDGSTAITLTPSTASELPSCAECGYRRTPAGWKFSEENTAITLPLALPADGLLLPRAACLWSRNVDDSPVASQPDSMTLWTLGLDEGLTLWSLDTTGRRSLVARWTWRSTEQPAASGDRWAGIDFNCNSPVTLVRTYAGHGADPDDDDLPPAITLVPVGTDCPAGSRDYRWTSADLRWNGLTPCPSGDQTSTEPPPRGLTNLETRERCCSETCGSAIVWWNGSAWQPVAVDCDDDCHLELPVDPPGEDDDRLQWIPCAPDDPEAPTGDCLWRWTSGAWAEEGTHACPDGTECREPEEAGTTEGELQHGACAPVDCAGKGCVWYGLGTGVGIQSWLLLSSDCPSHCDCPQPPFASSFLGDEYAPDCECSPGVCVE